MAACTDGRPARTVRKPPQDRPPNLHKVAPKCSIRSPQNAPQGRPKNLQKVAPKTSKRSPQKLQTRCSSLAANTMRMRGPKIPLRPPQKPPQGRPKNLHKVAPKCSTRSPQKPPKGRPKMLHKIAPGGSACPAHAEAAIHASGHQCTRPSMHARRRMNNRPQPGGEVNLKITTPIFIFFNNF